ncbi:MAG: hypothetical protein AAGE59_13340 [Cyanobacteria bacterium P01_F01_bin.86]
MENLLAQHKAYFSNIRHRPGYYKFSQVSKDILTHRERTAHIVDIYGLDAFNHDLHPNTASSALFAYYAGKAVFNDYPLYYLSRPVIEEFLATDLSSISQIIDTNFKPPLPLVFAAFPQQLIADSEGDYVSHVFIELSNAPNEPSAVKLCCNLKRPGVPPSKVVIASDFTFVVTEDGLNYGRNIWQKDSEEALAAFEKSPEGKLASIACQTLLILSMGDEYLDTGAAQPFTVRKKNRKGNCGPKMPRTIRFPKTQSARISAEYNLNAGTSKRPHWRRGHWRNQAHGPNHSLRRPRWIRPQRVVGKANADESVLVTEKRERRLSARVQTEIDD